MSATSFKNLDALLDEFIRIGSPMFDARVLYKGKEIYRRYYGFSDYDKTVPINGTEHYNLYSCSKFFTVTGALLLWEKGKFLLSDPVMNYLPEFAAVRVKDGDELRRPCRPITIRDLFAMRGGLTYNTGSENCLRAIRETDGKCPTREFMKYLAHDPLIFDPGQSYCYSLCHDVLAAVVEQVAGERFSDYMKKALFAPLGMENTTFRSATVDSSKIAAQYKYNPETAVYENCGKDIQYFIFGSEYESGGAGCRSTVDDYLRFLEGLRGGNVLRGSTIRMMCENTMSYELGSWLPAAYGYGLGVRTGFPEKGAYDFGWDGAARSFAACDLTHDYTMFVAQHALDCPTAEERFRLPVAVLADLSRA